MKTCITCHALISFPKSSECRKCVSSRCKERYYQKNKLQIREKQKKYREENRKLCQERSKRSMLKKYDHYRLKRRENYRRKHGIPLDDPFVKRKNGEGSIDSSGYKTITIKGHPNAMDERGRIREHVYIMSVHLNRPLFKGETVHHKNGNRLDNSIENLELWDRSHPPGQRVEDKIKWAIEFLERYGYKVSK